MNPVYFYIPNLIGYSRVIFAVLAFYYMKEQPLYFFVFYSLSAWLDIADGHAARAFGQTSRFGAVLDMITDRASTSCLIVVLSLFFPRFLPFFLFLIALDIMSHFAHVYSSLVRGNTSHKAINEKQSWLLRLYYTNRLMLGFMCFGNEGFFVFLYVLHFWQGPMLPSGPLAPLLELVFGVPQIGIVQAITFFFFFPIMAVKQSINVVQMLQAGKDIAELDLKDIAAKKK